MREQMQFDCNMHKNSIFVGLWQQAGLPAGPRVQFAIVSSTVVVLVDINVDAFCN